MITVQLEQEVTQQDRMTVIQMIRQFNQHFFPLSEWQSIAVFARDESGLIVGGVLGEIGCDWLYRNRIQESGVRIQNEFFTTQRPAQCLAGG
ncbi:MAG: hypothetical protein V7L14_17440 [Nostoc sp.]|uniref:hypothetical protein n=1 Tax=Nostoc sp. TaxID=1180 RepID=UPI002FF9427C